MIEFSNIKKSFKSELRRKKTTVLHGINFSVQQGEIFGFLGPNGAGKSTSIKLLMDFIRPDAGEISINGLRVGRDPLHHLIGYLPETPCFYENLTGLETLWFAGKASDIPGAQVAARSMEVLKSLNLAEAGKNPIRTYSKGMKQRLGLAVALLHDPLIYILDEPMSGLDPMGRRLITDVILELRRKGKTVFFSSHILSDIERLCDRVGILDKGRLLYCGDVKKILHNYANMEDAFIGFIEGGGKASNA